MKIEKTALEDHQVQLNVELETEVLEGAKRKAGKRIAKKVKISGFRPGKAPYEVVVRQVGEPAILEEAIDILLEEHYPKIIEEADISPFGPGSLQNIASMEPPVFEFLVPLAPEVDLKDYREIRIDFEPKEVTQKDIDEYVDNIRQNQAVIEPADRPAEENDMVYIVLTGEKEDAKDEEEKVLVEERRFPVVIEGRDVDQEEEWPFPGFSRKLIGLKAEDTKTLKHKFSKDYEFEDLRGVKAVYNVTVEEVKARILPEVDEEFAKTTGDFESVDEMMSDIKESLQVHFENTSKADYEEEIMQAILDQAEIKHPPQMLEEELNHFMSDMENRIQQQGLSMDIYLKSREMELEDLREELKPNAEDRLKRGLILMEVANQEDISVSQDEVQNRVQATLDQINAAYPEEVAKQFSSGDALQGLISQILTDEITSRTLERLRKISNNEPIEEEKEEAEEEESAEEPSQDQDEETSDDETTNPEEESPSDE